MENYLTEDFAKSNLSPFAKKKGSKSWFIVCPFHSDKDPSLSVIIEKGHKQGIGFWRCFGCGRAGNWNELASALNMPTIEGLVLNLVETDAIEFNIDKDWEPVTEFTCGKNSKHPRIIRKKSLIPWQELRIWRGFSGKVVQDYDGYLNILDSDYPLSFLCRRRNTHTDIGLILCRLKKKESYPSYLFTDGSWTSQFLWPEHKLKNTKYVMLVEGVRDALAWNIIGIPTLALLGTQTGLSHKRFSSLIGLGVEKVILFLDGDEAGKKAVFGNYDKTLVKPGLKHILEKDFEVVILETWKYYPRKDPFTLAKNKLFVEKFKNKVGNYDTKKT